MIVDLSRHSYKEYWDMKIDLGFICESEGHKKHIFNKAGIGKWVPIVNRRDVKKILRHVAIYAEDSKLADIQEYLDENSREYGGIFRELCATVRDKH